MKPPAPGPGERALRDPRDERGRDAGVDGVAALGQHLGPRLGGERCPAATAPRITAKATAGGADILVLLP